ncbi:MAG: ribonuclease HI [Magnetococcales bacterium]|nr:ribonuclease HI [Magnetococcales bacterium]
MDPVPAPVQIFTDGACSGNPGPGGWGALIEHPSSPPRSLSGFSPQTTNNRMELLAAIRALEATSREREVSLITDSSYVKNGITQWIHSWKVRGWRKSDGGAVLNSDLWQALDALCRGRRLNWQWVRGHNGHPGNEAADTLAREAIRLGLAGHIPPDQLGMAASPAPKPNPFQPSVST